MMRRVEKNFYQMTHSSGVVVTAMREANHHNFTICLTIGDSTAWSYSSAQVGSMKSRVEDILRHPHFWIGKLSPVSIALTE
jgi:hypothetical protein